MGSNVNRDDSNGAFRFLATSNRLVIAFWLESVDVMQ